MVVALSYNYRFDAGIVSLELEERIFMWAVNVCLDTRHEWYSCMTMIFFINVFRGVLKTLSNI